MQTVIYNTKCDTLLIKDIIHKLKNGAVGIFPTDTVYGIGCDALNENAIHSLYDIKQRDLSKPINILVSNMEMVKRFVTNINSIEGALIKEFWPGALTIIFNKSSIVPNTLTSNLDTIGIRMPNNNLCLDIIEQFNSPLAMSSANISENPPATMVNTILNDFNSKVDFIIDNGEIKDGVPSTIVKVEDNKIKILREGSISIDSLRKIGKVE